MIEIDRQRRFHSIDRFSSSLLRIMFIHSSIHPVQLSPNQSQLSGKRNFLDVCFWLFRRKSSMMPCHFYPIGMHSLAGLATRHGRGNNQRSWKNYLHTGVTWHNVCYRPLHQFWLLHIPPSVTRRNASLGLVASFAFLAMLFFHIFLLFTFCNSPGLPVNCHLGRD